MSPYRHRYDEEKYMTIQEAADYLGVTRDFLEIRVKRGIFKITRRGRRDILLEREEVKRKKGRLA